MNKINRNNFIFNWILKNKLAIGTSPLSDEDLNFLTTKKVKNIIGFCSNKEIEWHKKIYVNFNCERIVLPDSRTKLLPKKDDLKEAFTKLRDAVNKDITFVHCFASIERSPLICVMYIMHKYNLSVVESLDYVKSVHSYANPTNKQLELIGKIIEPN